MTDSPLTSSLAALSRFFVGDGSLKQTLERVMYLTVDAVEPADLCGITMPVEGRKRTAVFTDATAPEVDQAQYDTGDGPCITAFDQATVVEIPSTVGPGPWPEFRRVAAAHGILSTLSLPLVVDKAAVGAMNLYGRRPRSFGDADRETAVLFASQAAIVLANAQAYWDARDLGAGLGEAMKNRAVIEQAKGILMAGQGCDEDAAFQMLVRASQRENVKLREVARRVVDSAVHRARAAGANGARAGR
jgi:transcriptional regulator with GAF, ATPase, and Fis domain